MIDYVNFVFNHVPWDQIAELPYFHFYFWAVLSRQTPRHAYALHLSARQQELFRPFWVRSIDKAHACVPRSLLFKGIGIIKDCFNEVLFDLI